LNCKLKRRLKKIDNIEKWTEAARRAIEEKPHPLEFLSEIESNEEEIRNAAMTADPKIEKHWFTMPQARLRYLEEAIKSLKYSEKLLGLPYNHPAVLGAPFSAIMEGEAEGSEDIDEFDEFDIEF